MQKDKKISIDTSTFVNGKWAQPAVVELSSMSTAGKDIVEPVEYTITPFLYEAPS